MGKRGPRHPGEKARIPPKSSDGGRGRPQLTTKGHQYQAPPRHASGRKQPARQYRSEQQTASEYHNKYHDKYFSNHHQYQDRLGVTSASHSSGSQQSQEGGWQTLPHPNKSYISSTSSNTSGSGGSQKLYFTSPRCELPDKAIFPNTPTKRNSLTNVDDRWKTMSKQAGSHKQDSSVLHVSRRQMTPSVLKAGVPPKVANRIKELHLRLDQAEDMLPEWLDVISQKFPHLEHLVLTKDDTHKKRKKESQSDSQPSRLRRLYILYRLPHLISIDGVEVTKSERRLARPDDPNGNKVVSKDEWYHLGSPTTDNNSNSKIIDGSRAKQKEPKGSNHQTKSRKNEQASPKSKSKERQSKQSSADHRKDFRNSRNGRGMDECGNDDEGFQQVSLAEVATESAEGYELDLDIANAINKIAEARSSSPAKRNQSGDHEAERRKGSSKKSPGKPTEHSKLGLDKALVRLNEAGVDHIEADTLEFVECDSTVTSSYGYGHWSGACLAPFQVCTSRPKRKSKDALSKVKPTFLAKMKEINDGNAVSTVGKSNGNKAKHHHLSDVQSHDAQPPKSDQSSNRTLNPAVPKSQKYSTLVDESNVKKDMKQRNKFRESATNASLAGSSSAPSSRRSHKYSQIIFEVNEKEGNSSDDDESIGSQENRWKEPQPLSHAKASPSKHQPLLKKTSQTQPTTVQPKQVKSQSKSQGKTAAKAKSQNIEKKNSYDKKKAKDQHEENRASALDEDDIGTMTGVSIAVVKDANSGMSVTTIPSVLQRQAERINVAKITLKDDNLASRRNLAGVTIDVPPHTPNDALREPKNKSNEKLKKSQQTKEMKPRGASSVKQDDVALSAGKQNVTLHEEKRKPEKLIKDTTREKTNPPRRIDYAPTNTMHAALAENNTMENRDGPSDAEIVDMVLNKPRMPVDTPPSIPVGAKIGTVSDTKTGEEAAEEALMNQLTAITMGQRQNWTQPELQIPALTPVAGEANDNATAPKSISSTKVFASEGSDARSVKIFNKVKAKQQLKKQHSKREPNHSKARQIPALASSSVSQETSTGDSGMRSKESKEMFVELEARLDSLIQDKNRLPPSLNNSSIPGSPRQDALAHKDQEMLTKTVNKLDENLKIMTKHQRSPRRDRGHQLRRPAEIKSNKKKRGITIDTSGASEASPLEKLETTMAGLFASIMAQMSPQRPKPESPAKSMFTSSKREKSRELFFSKETERTLNKLEIKKSNEDDSTLFVVEIQNQPVPDSVTNDFDLRPGKDKIHIEAPSIINLVEPSVQSSVTNLVGSTREATKGADASDQGKQGQISSLSISASNDQQTSKGQSVIDLCDKSLTGVGGGNDTDGPEIINLVDVDNPRDAPPPRKPQQLMLPSLNHEAGPPAALKTGSSGKSKATLNSQQASKVGMVVTLPTVFENEVISAKLSNKKGDEVDGQCIAAAAAGAAAGAEASVDGLLQPSATSESDFPSEFIQPSSALIPTTEAVVDGRVDEPRLPQEIITSTDQTGKPKARGNGLPQEITTNAILKILQTPIRSKDDFLKQMNGPEATFADSISNNPYPEEVLVQKQPHGDLGLAARRSETSLASLSRKIVAHLGSCNKYGTEESDFSEGAYGNSPPGQQESTMPKEVLALFQNSVAGEDAMALLPNEIILRLQHSLTAASCRTDNAPNNVPQNTGPPQEILGCQVENSNRQSQQTAIPASIPESVRLMLEKYDRGVIAFTQSHDLGTYSHAQSDNVAVSLPEDASSDQPDAAEEVDLSYPPSRQITNSQNRFQSWHGPALSGFPHRFAPPSIGAMDPMNRTKSEESATGYIYHAGDSHTGESLVDDMQALLLEDLPSVNEPASSTERGGSPISIDPNTVEVSHSRFVSSYENNAETGFAHEYPPSLPSRVAFGNTEAHDPAPLPSRVVVNRFQKLQPSVGSSSPGNLKINSGSLPSNVVVDEPLSRNRNSYNKATPPSKSLASPFPMQFRSILTKSPVPSTPIVESLPDSLGEEGRPLAPDISFKPSTNVIQQSDEPGTASLTPRETSQHLVEVQPEQSPKQRKPSTTIPLSKQRKKPVASALLKSRAKKSVARNNEGLPPHNLASTRRAISSMSPRSEKMQKTLSRWKQKKVARSNSILDGDEEEDDEDEAEVSCNE